jgi:5-dehydro-4-deoxyglucarate dehydratase
VALVKAAVRLEGLDVGPVRTPLTDLPPAHVEELTAIIANGRTLLEKHRTEEAK